MMYKSGVIAILSVVCALLVIDDFFVRQENKFWANDRANLKEERNYYFDGANKRQYLDICKNAKGETGVWFKDECVDNE